MARGHSLLLVGGVVNFPLGRVRLEIVIIRLGSSGNISKCICLKGEKSHPVGGLPACDKCDEAGACD